MIVKALSQNPGIQNPRNPNQKSTEVMGYTDKASDWREQQQLILGGNQRIGGCVLVRQIATCHMHLGQSSDHSGSPRLWSSITQPPWGKMIFHLTICSKCGSVAGWDAWINQPLLHMIPVDDGWDAWGESYPEKMLHRFWLRSSPVAPFSLTRHQPLSKYFKKQQHARLSYDFNMIIYFSY